MLIYPGVVTDLTARVQRDIIRVYNNNNNIVIIDSSLLRVYLSRSSVRRRRRYCVPRRVGHHTRRFIRYAC